MAQFNDLVVREHKFGNWQQAVSFGAIPDFFGIYVFGVNPDLDTGAEENLIKWGTYTFQTSATPFYVTSSNAGDVGLTYIAVVLDEDFNELVIPVTTNGQTPVQIIGPNGETDFTRGQILFNVTPAGTASLGDVYVGTEAAPVGGVPADANIVLFAEAVDQQSNQSIYTVPRGRTGLIQAFAITTNRNSAGGNSDVFLNTKDNILPNGTLGGGPKRRRAELGLQVSGSSAFLYNLPLPVRVTEGTDVWLGAVTDNNNTRLAGGFQMLTIRNDYA